jgi:hypothetical protein
MKIFSKVIKAVQYFEKIDINETDSFFQFDYLSSSLSILERRTNTAVLNLILKVKGKIKIVIKYHLCISTSIFPCLDF